MWLCQTIIFLSLISQGYTAYCQNCYSSPCGYYGRDSEWCFTGSSDQDVGDRLFGGALTWKKCAEGRCPSDLPCSKWLDGVDATGGRRWPVLRGLTKTECLERCRQTDECVGAVLMAGDDEYKHPDVTGTCHRSAKLSAGQAWINRWSKSKFTGFLTGCERTLSNSSNPPPRKRASQQSNSAKNWDSFIDGHIQRLNGFVKKVFGEFSTTMAPTTTAVYQTNLSETGDAYIQKIYEVCGKVAPGRSTELIVKDTGGQFSVPWVVSLGFYQNSVYYHQCGGSLITSKHILTAAHCVASSVFDINRWVVRLGDRNLSSKTDDLNVKELGMRKAVMHPNFRRTRKVDKQSLYFDAAVIIMRTKVNTAFIPICLPKAAITNPSSLTNQALTIVGYGIDDQEKIGRHLLKDTVAVREKEYCDEAHRNAGQDQERVNAALPDLFIDSLFCADQDIDKKIGPCSGDSGSPAFQRIFKGGDRFVVQGIVSGAIECKSERYPNFYTLVSSQDILPWIQKELVDSKDDDTTLYRFPNEELSNIPCFEDSDCPKDHDFVCSPVTQVCLKPSSTSYLYLNTANTECPTATPCLIRGSCNKPVCNRHDICWCSAFQQTTQEAETSTLEENECSGRQCQGECECPTCTPYCVKGRCQKQPNSVQSQLLPHSTCSTNIYNFPSANTSNWDIPCTSEDNCPRDWFCSGRCYPPSSNPSGSSDNSLYVPTVSGLSYLSGSCTLCTQGYICPPLLPCSDGSHCVKPVCSPSIRGKPSFCWCDLFASQAKKTTSCLAVKSCADIQQQIKRARQLGQAGRSGQIRRIQRFIRDNKCTMLDGKSGVLC